MNYKKYKNTEKVVSRSCSISTLSAPAVLTEYIHDHLPVTINEMKTTAITKEKSVTFVSRASQINQHGKPLTQFVPSRLNLDILLEHSYDPNIDINIEDNVCEYIFKHCTSC